MSLPTGFLLAFVVVVGGLVLFAKALRGTAYLLDRFADALRSWADKREKRVKR
jgi:hypothetical protein